MQRWTHLSRTLERRALDCTDDVCMHDSLGWMLERGLSQTARAGACCYSILDKCVNLCITAMQLIFLVIFFFHAACLIADATRNKERTLSNENISVTSFPEAEAERATVWQRIPLVAGIVELYYEAPSVWDVFTEQLLCNKGSSCWAPVNFNWMTISDQLVKHSETR